MMANGEDTGNGRELTIYEKLAEPFPFECVEWRAQTLDRNGERALALAYIDARSVMARLDETVGPQNWRDSYRHEGGRMIGRLEMFIEGEWRWKEDGSGDSNFEGEKGGISGAFKRAGVKWGIGRYLYDVDALWADCRSRKGRGDRDKPVFVDWTDSGRRALDDALRRAPGPRTTGKPFTVEKMLELIRDAKDVAELRRIHEEHWATIPMEYRREVLEAKDRRKQELQSAAGEQEEQGRGGSRRRGRDDDRERNDRQ